jgi:hypothetical protein
LPESFIIQIRCGRNIHQLSPACQRIELAGLSRWRERSACNLIRSAINGGVMPYVLKLYLYLFVAGVVGFLVARWGCSLI